MPVSIWLPRGIPDTWNLDGVRWGLDHSGLVENVPAQGRGWNGMSCKIPFDMNFLPKISSWMFSPQIIHQSKSGPCQERGVKGPSMGFQLSFIQSLTLGGFHGFPWISMDSVELWDSVMLFPPAGESTESVPTVGADPKAQSCVLHGTPTALTLLVWGKWRWPG